VVAASIDLISGSRPPCPHVRLKCVHGARWHARVGPAAARAPRQHRDLRQRAARPAPRRARSEGSVVLSTTPPRAPGSRPIASALASTETISHQTQSHKPAGRDPRNVRDFCGLRGQLGQRGDSAALDVTGVGAEPGDGLPRSALDRRLGLTIRCRAWCPPDGCVCRALKRRALRFQQRAVRVGGSHEVWCVEV
jgi:hypothetical protein